MLRLRAARMWCALGAVLAAPPAFASPFVLQRTYLGQAPLDQFGFAVQSAGDVNGDRFADFLIGANVSDGGAPGGGRVYLYCGGPEYPSTPLLRYTGTHESENVGGAVAGGADLDGDGFDDWAAGAPGMGASGNDPGRVYVFLGGAVPDSVPALVIEGTTPGGQFGASVLLVRDLDGDGYGDLVVGAPRAGNGAVSIFRGGPRPLDGVADRVIHARPGDYRFGRALACLPDDNGDGRWELLVGAPRSSQGATWAGAVVLYRGTTNLDSIADLTLLGAAAGDEFGSSVAAGVDVSGDQDPDIVVGAPYANVGLGGTDAGKAYVFHGGSSLDALADLTLSGSSFEEHFGTSVALGFDWDGDGATDLAVGSPENDAGGADAGACFVFRGGAALDAISDATILGTGPGTHLGTSAAAAGDVRHNRGGTLVTGGYGLSDSGRALLYGSNELPTSIGAEPVALPGVRLVPAWPNPFNPEVQTRLETDATAAWSVDVLDVRGRRVAQILSATLGPGRHPLLWNGCDAAGRPVASGVYRIRARSAASTTTIPVTLLR